MAPRSPYISTGEEPVSLRWRMLKGTVLGTATQPTTVEPMKVLARDRGVQVLGELLLDFLHLFGEDFDIGREGFSVRGGGFRFCVHGNPPHPQAGDPIVIEVGVDDQVLVDARRVSCLHVPISTTVAAVSACIAGVGP